MRGQFDHQGNEPDQANTGNAGEQALHFVPPLFAFFVGVVIAAWLRRAFGPRAVELSLLVEIGMLIFVGVLHNRMPGVAGTLGISMVAAMQTSIFTRVEGSLYSSVMITGNFRQAIEGAFAVVAGDAQAGVIRKSCVFMAVCAAFGTGAAAGAFITEQPTSDGLHYSVRSAVRTFTPDDLKRSTAASVMAGSGKTLPHSPKGWLAVMSMDRRSYRALISSNKTDVSA